MASHESDAPKKSHFHLLRDHINVRKKGERLLILRLILRPWHIGHEFAKANPTKKPEAEVVALKEQLSAMTAEKGTLSTEMGELRKKLNQVEYDMKTWIIHCLEAQDKGKKTSVDLAETNHSLEELKVFNVDLDKEVWDLKACVVDEHELGFEKALRQAVILYNVPADDKRFDVTKMSTKSP
ncbi:hypothetical protein DEO72_LG3g1319 [Vigna unguiculata]|uniref:Uncharacterized protein n=1 Tax=Vigna unguiculata TaxID=3917 RepID=A0A4D6LE80_VIGUN|nr:hypothetical protein DEO72_LG3g1319 [Vigna unguiculata]